MQQISFMSVWQLSNEIFSAFCMYMGMQITKWGSACTDVARFCVARDFQRDIMKIVGLFDSSAPYELVYEVLHSNHSF